MHGVYTCTSSMCVCIFFLQRNKIVFQFVVAGTDCLILYAHVQGNKVDINFISDDWSLLVASWHFSLLMIMQKKTLWSSV